MLIGHGCLVRSILFGAGLSRLQKYFRLGFFRRRRHELEGEKLVGSFRIIFFANILPIIVIRYMEYVANFVVYIGDTAKVHEEETFQDQLSNYMSEQ